MMKNMRKWLGLILAVVLYYIIHEGAHLLMALLFGTFQSIRFAYWGLGIQIVANTAAMSAVQIFVFGIAGVVATLLTGYVLVWKRGRILQSRSKLLRAAAYYTTLIFLCLDPLYLAVLYRFVGGGDMNSLTLIGVPETVAAICFFLLLIINGIVFVKLIYPSYKQRFLAGQLP